MSQIHFSTKKDTSSKKKKVRRELGPEEPAIVFFKDPLAVSPTVEPLAISLAHVYEVTN
jgi:hypothetical protein